MNLILGMWGASAILGIATYLIMTKREKRSDPCDTCDRLERKNQKSMSTCRYICTENGSFDKPPEYCCDYVPRHNATEEDNADQKV